MSIPGWFQLTLLSLAAFRIWRLLSEDTILDKPRNRLLRLGSWKAEGDIVPPEYRKEFGIFLECPWCLGFHVSLGVYLLWIWFPTETLTVSVPLAISSLVGAIAHTLEPK